MIKDSELPLKKRRRRNKTIKEDNEILINGFKPSKYQNDIFDFVKYGYGNAVIKALAGASKTTTIVNSVKLIPSTCKALFIAFNRDIVKELEKKLEGVNNVNIRTLHSLGFLMIKRNIKNSIEIDEFKYRAFIKTNIKSISNGAMNNLSKREKDEYIDNIIMLTDFSRFNLCQSSKEIVNIANRYDISILSNECDVVLSVLEWGKNNYQTIDFTDMVWLPYELDVKPIGLQYDFIFVDESQDLNIAQRELFLRCFKNGTRFIAVGDPNQCIYSFAGADYESFNKLMEIPNTKVFPLPISYRCPKKIIDLANQFVGTMEPRENAPDGNIIMSASIKDVKDGDMVLCRLKYPLLVLYMKYLRMGKNCFIRGKDIGLNLIKMVESTGMLNLSPNLDKDGVFVRLYDKLIDDRNRIIERRGLDLEDATLSSNIMSQYDSIKSLEVISEGIDNSKDLINRINTIFSEGSDGICLSTIHKAKGLESDNVYILCKSLMPSKLAKQDWEIQQEENLMYVAYTRAKYNLGFISEKEFSIKNTEMEHDKILSEINFIENKISKITGRKPLKTISNKELKKLNIERNEKKLEKNNNSAFLEKDDITDEFVINKIKKLIKEKGAIEANEIINKLI